MIFYVVEFVIILVLIHQVVIPAFKGLPLFPFFREQKLVEELTEVKQRVEEKKIQDQIKNVKSELKGKK